MTKIAQLVAETEIPVVIADHLGLITHINESFEKAFRWERGNLVGKELEVLIPRNLWDAHRMGFSQFYATGSGTLLNQPLELKIVTGDGTEMMAEHTIFAEKIDGEWVLGAWMKPSLFFD